MVGWLVTVSVTKTSSKEDILSNRFPVEVNKIIAFQEAGKQEVFTAHTAFTASSKLLRNRNLVARWNDSKIAGLCLMFLLEC
jgi:hypothetical protein